MALGRQIGKLWRRFTKDDRAAEFLAGFIKLHHTCTNCGQTVIIEERALGFINEKKTDENSESDYVLHAHLSDSKSRRVRRRGRRKRGKQAQTET